MIPVPELHFLGSPSLFPLLPPVQLVFSESFEPLAPVD
jgi:hypothetical protein